MPTNAPVIVLSDGRSMFKNTLQVCVTKDVSKPFDQAKFSKILEDEQMLNEMRKFVLLLSYNGDKLFNEFSISAEVSEYA